MPNYLYKGLSLISLHLIIFIRGRKNGCTVTKVNTLKSKSAFKKINGYSFLHVQFYINSMHPFYCM